MPLNTCLHEACVSSAFSAYTCLSLLSCLLVSYIPCRKASGLPKMTVLPRCSRYSGKAVDWCRKCSSLQIKSKLNTMFCRRTMWKFPMLGIIWWLKTRIVLSSPTQNTNWQLPTEVTQTTSNPEQVMCSDGLMLLIASQCYRPQIQT